MLESAEAERTALRLQNDDLVQRVVGEKSRNAEEMNRMTELVEQMRRQLKAQGINVGTGAANPTITAATPTAASSAAAAVNASGANEVPASCTLQFKAHAADVNDVVFNDTCQLLATAGSDGRVRVWEAGTGRLRHTLQGQDVMLGLDVRGDMVACGSSDTTCRLWSLSTGRAHRTLVGHSGNVYAVKLLGGDGRSVLTGAADRTVRVWDVGRASCKQVLRSGSTCNGLDVSVDGHLPVSAHQDGGLRLWDLRSGNPTMIIRAFETQATSVAYGQAFTVLANSRDNVLKVIDTRTYETLHALRHEEYRTFLNWSRACFSPSNAHVAAGSAGGALIVWELSSGQAKAALAPPPAEGPGSALGSFSSSSSLSASGSGSGGSVGGLTNCAWGRASSGGGGARLAACSKGGMVYLWA
jgi:WD40 repeat protein